MKPRPVQPTVKLLDWGTIDYPEALERQRELFGSLIAGGEEESRRCRGVAEADRDRSAGWMIFCEHPHVYTLGRSGKIENLLVNEASLREKGAALHRTERGGDITYHGPGQIVCYPVLDLEKVGLSLREYIAAMEQAVIETVARFGMEAGRAAGKTGVWVSGEATDASVALRDRKICAIGVKASRGVVMHGLALNVATDLGWFEMINPCGFAGGAVTSIEKETGRRIEMSGVKRLLGERLKENLRII